MSISGTTQRVLALAVCLQLVIAGQTASVAQAEMVSTSAAVSKYIHHANKELLLSELQKAEVREEIISQGVDPIEAEARLRALSG